jgi:hypothetical protein
MNKQTQNILLELYNSNPEVELKILYKCIHGNKNYTLQKLIRMLSQGIKNGMNFKHDDDYFYVYQNEKPRYSFRLNIPIEDHYLLIEKHGAYTDHEKIKKHYIS